MVVDVKINEQAKSEEVPEPEDTRPVAVKTGDEDVDKQSEKDGYWTCRGLMPLL
ncbi:hypothetical protein SAMN04488527_1251 [Aliiroseovarius crassostreae]|nr:hypothetical protein SAMN04488527_1251 [Aliiroseovarius crassostreae]